MPPERARYVRFNTLSLLLGVAVNLVLLLMSVALWPPMFSLVLAANLGLYTAFFAAALRGRHLLAKIGFNYGSLFVFGLLTLAVVQIKGKGELGTFWLEAPRAAA